MAQEDPYVLTLPRFSRWMKLASAYAVGAWLALVLLHYAVAGLDAVVLDALRLSPRRTLGGLQLWRLATYALVEDPTRFGVLWTVLAFWLIGSPAEKQLGARRVLELLVVGALGGGLVGALAGVLAPSVFAGVAVGLGPASSALLAGWGYAFGDQQVTFFGAGPLRGRQMVIGLGAVLVLLSLLSRSVDGAAQIGGLLAGAGWMWARGRRGAKPKPKPKGPRARSQPGRLRVVPGGRSGDDKHQWN